MKQETPLSSSPKPTMEFVTEGVHGSKATHITTKDKAAAAPAPGVVGKDEDMTVVKRNGKSEKMRFDKIMNRIKKSGEEVGISINYTALTIKIIDQLYDKIPTTKIDELTAEQCYSMASIHHDYGVLAARIIHSNHQRNTTDSFFTVMTHLYKFLDKHGKQAPMLSDMTYSVIRKYKKELDAMIVHDRDYLIDYFGFKTLERAYLMKVNRKVVERIQHMWLRVSVGIHGENMDKVKETYDLMSQKYAIHATPTLFNAGTPRPQLSSCYLLSMEDDSIEGIFNTLQDCAKISKWGGGIGLHAHNVRAKGSHIRGTNGQSNGLVPMLRVFNNTAKYVDQCFTPDTIVYTEAGPKAIEDIGCSDRVLTSKGEFFDVLKPVRHEYDGPMLSINSVRVTGEHQVLALQQEDCDMDVMQNRLDKGNLKPEFCDARELEVGDYLVYSIPTYVKDIAHLSLEDCRFYGILIAAGAIGNESVCVSLAEDHVWNSDFIEEYCSARAISYSKEIRDFVLHITISVASAGFKFVRDQFVDREGIKRIDPALLHLPVEKVTEVMRGICMGDFPNEIGLPSLKLLQDVRYIWLRMGYLVSVKDCWSVNQTMYVTVPNDKQKEYFRHGNHLYSRVESIEETRYKGIVHDFEIDGPHDYTVAHLGVAHNGGGKRNGSFAIYLEPWHADIKAFLQLKKNHGDEEMKARDLFYALWIPDLFMERMHKNGKWTLMCPDECPGLSDVCGDDFALLYEKYEQEGRGRETISARDLWIQILDAQMETGTPYILYKDTCNRKSNQKNLGTIKSSNLCVAPETKILTDKGHIEIQELHGQQVNVWNGEEFSEVIIHKTGENQELMEVETSDGCVLSCTPYHKFYIQNTYSKDAELVEAKDLKEGDKIMKCEFPVIDNDGKDDMKYAYTHGFFCGDGTYSNKTKNEEKECEFKALPNHLYCKRHIDYEDENVELHSNITNNKCKGVSYTKKPMVSLYGEKKELLPYLKYRSVGNEDKSGRLNVCLPVDINEKFDVPINGSVNNKMEWFSGYCDADGCIARNGDNQQLQVSSINKDFLMNIKMMLQTSGVNPKVTMMHNGNKRLMPDSNRNLKEYECKSLYRLLLTSYDLQKMVKIGFSPKRLIIQNAMPNRNAQRFIEIKATKRTGRIDDTYCFNEPKKHAGIFNGILTSQCTEIIEYSDKDETAVCNLASIALPSFVHMSSPHDMSSPPSTQEQSTCSETPQEPCGAVTGGCDNLEKKPTFVFDFGQARFDFGQARFDFGQARFDFAKLHEVAKILTYNLNVVIDINYYPTEKTKVSNMRHRPVGIGVQGLADVFMMMGLPFESAEAKVLNKHIFETIYHAALERSCELAAVFGPYETFAGSPASRGELQFDMWSNVEDSGRYDWTALKERIKEKGLRNSLLVAPMPTASTSQILGFNECFEPITSNIYSRGTNAGQFLLSNKYLQKDLIRLGLWNENVKNNIVANNGSIQQIDILPESLRNLYKTVWEIPMKTLIDLAVDRGAYICQSQSLNLWLEDPTYKSLTAMHYYSWKQGLKTGIYYLRRRARHQAQKFTIEPEKADYYANAGVEEEDEYVCEMCSA